jgi:[glutamine synthetase] adenylyltransferase / [glutamine synthetase]-adenylyl-L-tyrosine phosphorylase
MKRGKTTFTKSDIASAMRGIPEVLRLGIEQTWEAFVEVTRESGLSPPGNPDFIKSLYKVWATSDFIGQSCVQVPQLVTDLLDSGDLLGDYRPDEYHHKLATALDSVEDQDSLGEKLRIFRRREMVRIAWRDLAGWTSLGETMRDLSALADACLGHTTRNLHQWYSRDTGIPTGSRSKKSQSMLIIAMGKLGANELNFSSDVDLIFAYPEEGTTRRGRISISNEEYFIGLGQRIITTLNEVTDNGFVFRVDMRLRPFGESGPLVISFDAAEDYYQSQGREWERYAMIKARPIADHSGDGKRFITMLRPFVYRRYLDFGAFESLREMKIMISREVDRKGLQDNIKLGPGGIREIEFIGQAMQLIWGGRKPELQERSILTVLQRLARLGYIPEFAAHNLTAAYLFLRRVENRLQAFSDEQRHLLPADHVDCTRLAFSMGFPDWPAFAKQLEKHRSQVSNIFEQIFMAPQIGKDGTNTPMDMTSVASVWRDRADATQAIDILHSSGFETPEDALHQLELLRESYVYRSLSTKGRQRMDHLIPLLLGAVIQHKHCDRVLMRLLNLIETIASREVYLALLVENPMALSQLVKLCAASSWISALLTDHPNLLDELLDPRTLYAPLDRMNLENQLTIQLESITSGDLEAEMDILRHFKQANVLRVAAADVMGNMPLMVVSDHLTEIAEVILNKTLKIAINHLATRRERTQVNSKSDVRFAIIGYGKLGGIELGYGSDLDLVFLYYQADHDNAQQSVYFARLGQRIIHMLNTHTPAGVLYEVDMRLRPSGASGLLVSSIEAYEEYQRHDAWTWEQQALVRARVIAGDGMIKQRFEAVRREVLGRERDPENLRREVREMRERMRTELSMSRKGYFDVKQDKGGIADIEFIVQYGVLLWAHRNPELLRWTDNIRLLQEFARSGLMSESDVKVISDSYRSYRSCVHRLSLQEEDAEIKAGHFASERDAICRIWHELLES